MAIPTTITLNWIRDRINTDAMDEIIEAGRTTSLPEDYPTLWDELAVRFDEQSARQEARIAGDEEAATGSRSTLLDHFAAHRRERCHEALDHDLSLDTTE